MPITILLAEDHIIVREGLRSLIERKPDMEIVGEAENGRMALQLVRKLHPDVVVMDITMPELNGIEATQQIKNEMPKVRVVALSVHCDRRFVLGMLTAGASAFLIKECAFADLVRAIKAAVDGHIYLSPKIADNVIKEYLQYTSHDDGPNYQPLTSREREVLQLIAEGKSTRKIGAVLHISIKTVEMHRKNIMEKLNLHSIAELTKYALGIGLTTL